MGRTRDYMRGSTRSGDRSGDLPPGGIRTKGRTVMTMRQDVGALESDGRVRLDLTYEDMVQELRVNDNVLTVAETVDVLKGKTVTRDSPC